MGSSPQGTPFDVNNFPDLYPKNLQDAVNESYNHNKVLPRIEGQDYNLKITDKANEGNPTYSQEGVGTSDGESY